MIVIPVAGAPYILENLIPETTYQFQFAAKNDVGYGPWRNAPQITMPRRSEPAEPKIHVPSHSIPDDNSSNRQDVIAVSPYADHFELRWQVPNDNGDPIDYYLIRYCMVSTPTPSVGPSDRVASRSRRWTGNGGTTSAARRSSSRSNTPATSWTSSNPTLFTKSNCVHTTQSVQVHRRKSEWKRPEVSIGNITATTRTVPEPSVLRAPDYFHFSFRSVEFCFRSLGFFFEFLICCLCASRTK